MSQKRFHGHWQIQVVRNAAQRPNRYIVTGSDSSDGAYQADLGSTIDVTGQDWQIAMELSSNGENWITTGILESVTYTPTHGLVRQLTGHDDVILACRSLDPKLNPRIPAAPFFDFTITEDQLTRN